MDQFPPKELFQRELFDDFHNQNYFPADLLAEAQERFLKSNYLLENNLKPKLPDVWLVNKYPESLFVEVKRLKERFQEGQKEGLAIIKKYLHCNVRIARVCAESEAYSQPKFEDIDITDIYYEI